MITSWKPHQVLPGIHHSSGFTPGKSASAPIRQLRHMATFLGYESSTDYQFGLVRVQPRRLQSVTTDSVSVSRVVTSKRVATAGTSRARKWHRRHFVMLELSFKSELTRLCEINQGCDILRVWPEQYPSSLQTREDCTCKLSTYILFSPCLLILLLTSRAVQDYDLYLIHYDYFELLWLHYDSLRILNSLITVEYDMIWLRIQYDTVVIFNHNNNVLKCHRNAQFWCHSSHIW
jgi:hypothetical protein